MKRIILLPLALLSLLSIYGQQKLSYAYDASGNRVSRTIVMETRSALSSVNGADSIFYEETLDDKLVKIYPNPVESVLTIKISGFASPAQGEYALYNISGMMLSKRRVTGETTLVDMSRHAKGIYILHIILNEEPTVWRVIKK